MSDLNYTYQLPMIEDFPYGPTYRIEFSVSENLQKAGNRMEVLLYCRDSKGEYIKIFELNPDRVPKTSDQNMYFDTPTEK